MLAARAVWFGFPAFSSEMTGQIVRTCHPGQVFHDVPFRPKSILVFAEKWLISETGFI
jgi:hypothetical protein